MTTTTFYLKYRPQKLQELDSTEAREELVKIFKSGKAPHAFLFSGPKGIGKTSAARIVAKAVNCLQRTADSKQQKAVSGKLSAEDYEPCNECAACVSITKGTNVDVLEIDAASNRGIDDIKELREKIKLSPASLKYKVYIIDEVHMLTTEAFNALLKTLEEPPKHAIFILCTTDPEKLPKTITSRCLIVNFKRATQKEIIEKLHRICREEKLEFEEQALAEIAKISDGSFRDANKILEQVSFSGKITEDEVRKTAGVSREFSITEFLLMLQKRQTREALIWVNKAVEQGVNLKILTERFLDKLRDLLLSNFGIEEAKIESEFAFSKENLLCLINLFTRAYSELRFSVIPQLPLEMAIIEWSEKWEVGSESARPPASSLAGEVGQGSGKREMSKNENKENDPVPASHPRSSNFSLEDVISKWPEILEKVRPLNHSVLAFLRATRPLNCEGSFLILEVFYKFHKDQLEKDQCRKIFEKVASEVLGQEVKLRCSLSENPRPVKAIPKVDFLQNSQGSSEADIIKLAEEIFNKGGTVQ